MSSPEHTGDASRLKIPVAVAVTAILLTVSAVLGVQRMVEQEVSQQVAPLLIEMRHIRQEMQDIKEGLQTQTHATDALRLEMARRQGAER